MRVLLALILGFLILPLAAAQGYTPKPGETVLRLDIEGKGSIFIKLHDKKAPKATAQIIKLVRAGFYNGLRFHRVERTPKPYLVQIGDPSSRSGNLDGNGGSGAKIPYEDSGFKNERGAVGLAHPVDDPNGGDSQFYMLLDRSSFLDNNYTVFGRVVEGMDVLQQIRKGDKLTTATIISG